MARGCLIAFAALFAVSFVIAALTGGLSPKSSPPLTQQEREVAEARALTATAHRLMLAELKDPESADFNYDLPRRSGLFCGTVRARNSFGGYGNDVFYILFPFGLVANEQENSARFTRLWNLYCMGNESASAPKASENRLNDVILRAGAPDRGWMLGQIVGARCLGRSAYFMGSGKTGISKNVAFWSMRCSNGTAYEVGIYPDQSPRVLECSILERLHAGKCFGKLS